MSLENPIEEKTQISPAEKKTREMIDAFSKDFGYQIKSQLEQLFRGSTSKEVIQEWANDQLDTVSNNVISVRDYKSDDVPAEAKE